MATSSQNSDSYLGSAPDGTGKRIAIVASRFHSDICEQLVTGAVEALQQAGVAAEAIGVYRVPGAFELPLILQAIANTERFDAAVALGVVIRGETAHFDYVAGEAARGVREVMLKTGLPIGFGLLTTDNEEQARERAGGRLGHKGREAAWVALELATLLKEIAK